uniref:hypothetical protein n=1 Tax=Eikenella halliae TaxID=1795832 RepID=UPI00370D9B47
MKPTLSLFWSLPLGRSDLDFMGTAFSGSLPERLPENAVPLARDTNQPSSAALCPSATRT